MRVLILCLAAASWVPAQTSQRANVYVETVPIHSGAELATVFAGNGVPVVSVLRDSLGSADAVRLRNVWVLTYTRPTVGQKLAAAMPFFYKRFGSDKSHPIECLFPSSTCPRRLE
jgi:hypothetical protein